MYGGIEVEQLQFKSLESTNIGWSEIDEDSSDQSSNRLPCTWMEKIMLRGSSLFRLF